MGHSIDLFAAILLLGAAQGFFLALAILNSKSGSVIAHRWLAFVTTVFSVELGYEFLELSGYLVKIPDLQYFYQSIDLLYGPLIYLYVVNLTSPQNKSVEHAWRHFLPFLISLLMLAPYWMLDADQKLALLEGEITDQDAWLVVIHIIQILIVMISVLQIFLYLGTAIYCLIRHNKSIKTEFSDIERISLRWLRNLLLGLGALYLLYLIELFVGPLLGVGEFLGDSVDILTVILIYSMGYLGLRQPLIFASQRASDQESSGKGPVFSNSSTPSVEKSHQAELSSNSQDENEPGEESAEPSEQTKKYKKSALDSKLGQALKTELEAHMKNASPFLDNKLTLTRLADQMGISSNYLSQVINEQAGKNFFDYVNGYRVEVAKQHLLDPNKQTLGILGIAHESGFNSKTAFYTAFKKHTGMTPSQYKKEAVLAPN